MSYKETHLFTLTIGEFKEMNKQMLKELEIEILHKLRDVNEPKLKESDTIFLKELMELTGYKSSTVYSKVCRFEIPVLSKRKPLTFSKKAILKWMEAGKPSLMDEGSINYFNS